MSTGDRGQPGSMSGARLLGPLPLRGLDTFYLLTRIVRCAEGFAAVVSALPSPANALTRNSECERRVYPTRAEALAACVPMRDAMRKHVEEGAGTLVVPRDRMLTAGKGVGA